MPYLDDEKWVYDDGFFGDFGEEEGYWKLFLQNTGEDSAYVFEVTVIGESYRVKGYEVYIDNLELDEVVNFDKERKTHQERNITYKASFEQVKDDAYDQPELKDFVEDIIQRIE